MVADAADIVNGLAADIGGKCIGQLVAGTGLHEILPDDQAKLIA
jgi:hypothetical protein